MKRISFLRYLTGGLLAGPSASQALSSVTSKEKEYKVPKEGINSIETHDSYPEEEMHCIDGYCVPRDEHKPGKWTPHGPTT